MLEKGKDYSELPDRYTIFITEEDYFQKGLPVYRAENTIRELENRPLGDGGYIWYVNGAYRDESTAIGRLMHDFACENPDDIITPLLRDRVCYLKKKEEGKKTMCELVQNLMNEQSRDDRIECAKTAIADGKLPLETIALYFNLPLSTIEKLAEEQKKSV